MKQCKEGQKSSRNSYIYIYIYIYKHENEVCFCLYSKKGLESLPYSISHYGWVSSV